MKKIFLNLPIVILTAIATYHFSYFFYWLSHMSLIPYGIVTMLIIISLLVLCFRKSNISLRTAKIVFLLGWGIGTVFFLNPHTNDDSPSTIGYFDGLLHCDRGLVDKWGMVVLSGYDYYYNSAPNTIVAFDYSKNDDTYFECKINIYKNRVLTRTVKCKVYKSKEEYDESDSFRDFLYEQIGSPRHWYKRYYENGIKLSRVIDDTEGIITVPLSEYIDMGEVWTYTYHKWVDDKLHLLKNRQHLYMRLYQNEKYYYVGYNVEKLHLVVRGSWQVENEHYNGKYDINDDTRNNHYLNLPQDIPERIYDRSGNEIETENSDYEDDLYSDGPTSYNNIPSNYDNNTQSNDVDISNNNEESGYKPPVMRRVTREVDCPHCQGGYNTVYYYGGNNQILTRQQRCVFCHGSGTLKESDYEYE